MRPTAAQVWETITADSQFIAQAPEGSAVRIATRPFIEGSVEALGDPLENFVTPKVIFEAKVTFFRYCLENNFGKVVGDAVGMDADLATGMLVGLIEMLEPVIQNFLKFLEENGVTEEQIMIDPQIGLNTANQQKWRDGTLTLGELLLTQPAIILLNGK